MRGGVRRSDKHTLRSRKNKGFTLVELIVVIVILAILAAILVPATLGYIDQAKEKQAIQNAKSVYTATKAELSELYTRGLLPYEIFSRGSQIKEMTGLKGGFVLYIGRTNIATAETYQSHRTYTIYGISYFDSETKKTVLYYYDEDAGTELWTTDAAVVSEKQKKLESDSTSMYSRSYIGLW